MAALGDDVAVLNLNLRQISTATTGVLIQYVVFAFFQMFVLLASHLLYSVSLRLWL